MQNNDSDPSKISVKDLGVDESLLGSGKKGAKRAGIYSYPPIAEHSLLPELLTDSDQPPTSVSDVQDEDEEVQVEVFSCPVEHDGTAVYVKGWRADTNDRYPIVFIHDLGEHVGMYRQVGRRFAEQGYSFYGFDLRGHGRTGRALGHIGHFDVLIKDLLQVVAWVRHRSQHSPVIVGQGLGAIIALFFQSQYAHLMRGLVLMTPTWHHNDYLSVPKRALIHILAELFPTLRLPKRLTPKYLLAKVQDTRRDGQATSVTGFGRLRKYGITANFAREVLNALAVTEQKFDKLDCPTLLIVPADASELDLPDFEKILSRHHHRDRIALFRVPAEERQMLAGTNLTCANTVFERLRSWLSEELPQHQYDKSIKLDRRLFDGMPLA